MKKIMTLAVALCFTAVLSAGNAELKISNGDLNVACFGTVSVDCDGDGVPDYTGRTSCEYLQALLQQFMESC